MPDLIAVRGTSAVTIAKAGWGVHWVDWVYEDELPAWRRAQAAADKAGLKGEKKRQYMAARKRGLPHASAVKATREGKVRLQTKKEAQAKVKAAAPKKAAPAAPAKPAPSAAKAPKDYATGKQSAIEADSKAKQSGEPNDYEAAYHSNMAASRAAEKEGNTRAKNLHAKKAEAAWQEAERIRDAQVSPAAKKKTLAEKRAAYKPKGDAARSASAKAKQSGKAADHKAAAAAQEAAASSAVTDAQEQRHRAAAEVHSKAAANAFKRRPTPSEQGTGVKVRKPKGGLANNAAGVQREKDGTKTVQTTNGTRISLADAAAKMYGQNSPEHLTALADQESDRAEVAGTAAQNRRAAAAWKKAAAKAKTEAKRNSAELKARRHEAAAKKKVAPKPLPPNPVAQAKANELRDNERRNREAAKKTPPVKRASNMKASERKALAEERDAVRRQAGQVKPTPKKAVPKKATKPKPKPKGKIAPTVKEAVEKGQLSDAAARSLMLVAERFENDNTPEMLEKNIAALKAIYQREKKVGYGKKGWPKKGRWLGEVIKQLIDLMRGTVTLTKRDTSGSFTFDVPIHKTDEDQCLVFGWAQITHTPDGRVVLDKQGDFIDDIADLEKAAYEYVLTARDGGEMHVRKGVATLVESMVFTPEKMAALGIPAGTLPLGWWGGWKVSDPAVWQKVKNGEYSMLSVGGRGRREYIDI